MLRQNLSIAAAIACLGACTLPASANGLGAASSFNVWVLGNATTNGGESEGAVAVGGNWNLQNNWNSVIHNIPGVVPGDDHIGSYIQGNLSGGGRMQLEDGTDLYVGSTVDSSNQFNYNSGTFGTGKLLTGNNPVADNIVSQSAKYLTNLSGTLAGYAGTSVDTSNQNGWTLDASTANTYSTGSGKSLVVFDVAASALSDNAIIALNNVTSNDSILVNVTGSLNGIQWNADAQNSSSIANQILWNYTGSDSFSINRIFDGSLLAPNATVTQSADVNGTLIAGNWNNTGVEDHSYNFTGNLPSPPPVPEASSVLGLAGMLAIGGLSVRRRR